MLDEFVSVCCTYDFSALCVLLAARVVVRPKTANPTITMKSRSIQFNRLMQIPLTWFLMILEIESSPMCFYRESSRVGIYGIVACDLNHSCGFAIDGTRMCVCSCLHLLGE